MFTYDAVLAAALLTAPPTPLPTEQGVAWSDRLRPALIALAVEAELLSLREVDGVFQKPVQFAYDLKMLRERWQDLFCAPLVEESRRFPGCSLAKEHIALNRAVREELRERLSWDETRAHEIQRALDENDQLHRVWEEVRYANGPHDVHVRRQALARLRDLIGMEAFYRGQLPPHVPLWLFPVAR
jgi:hypothetical protein